MVNAKEKMAMAYYVGQDAAARQIQGIDALRTLAIVGVTLFHMFPDVVKGGYLGVSLFFVLTGYLLAYTSENERLAGDFHVLRYYGKRIRRMYPALLVMIFAVAGIYAIFQPEAVGDIREEAISVVLGYNNWWQIAQNADYFARIANASPFTHLWFMGIELQYCLLWPLFFLLYVVLARAFGKNAGVAVLALFGLGTALFMPLQYRPDLDVTRLYYGTDTRIFALLLGAAMGLCHAGRSAPKIRALWQEVLEFAAFEFLLIAVLVAYALLGGESAFLYQGGMFLLTLVFCLLLAVTTDRGMTIGKFLDAGIFRWIGRRSYGIFLWQYPVIYWFQQKGWDSRPDYPFWALLLIVLLAMWTEALTKSVMKRELPAIGGRLVYLQGVFFLAVTMGGVLLMGFGCRGLAAPAGYSTRAESQAELKARLEQNAAELERQKEAAAKAEAAREAEEKAARMQAVRLNDAACIGDSVMLSAAGSLQEVLPGCAVDAEVSRYVGGGIEAAQNLAVQGRLGNLVVVSLGTNGPISGNERYEAQTKQLLAMLGPKRRIFWVNVYCPHLKWQDPNNAYINKIAAEHSNVTVVDWYGLISGHPEWLSGDGVHPNNAGVEQYAKLIHDTMAETLAARR